MLTRYIRKNHHHGQLIGGAAKYAAVYTPTFVKAVVSGIKEALGIKAYLQHPNHLHQAFTFGKNLGSQAHVFAQDCLELDRPMDFTLTLDFAVKRAQHPHQPLDFRSTMDFEMLHVWNPLNQVHLPNLELRQRRLCLCPWMVKPQKKARRLKILLLKQDGR